MAIIIRSDSRITNPEPGTPTLVIPPNFLNTAILDWDAKDLTVGAFSTWTDRIAGVTLDKRNAEGSAAVVNDYGKTGLRISETSIGVDDYVLDGDVTKVIVFRPEDGIGASARLYTSAAASYRSMQAMNNQYLVSSNLDTSPAYASAPGAFGEVQAHASAWEGGHTVRSMRDGGELVTATGSYPTGDSKELRIGGRMTSAQTDPTHTLTGVIHKMMIFGRALSAHELQELTTYLAQEWA